MAEFMKRTGIILINLLFLIGAAYADIDSGAGTRSSTFLRIGSSARSSAMADAFTAMTGDVACMSWNPAGIAGNVPAQFCASYGKWFVDTNFGNLSLILPGFGRSALGLSVTDLDYGSLTRISGQDVYGTPIEDGTFGASDMDLSLSYARTFGSSLKAGITAKALRFKIDDDTAVGYGMDAGVNYSLMKNMQFGLAYRNLGTGGKLDETAGKLPEELSAGLMRRIPLGRSSLLVAVDAVEPTDNRLHYRAGLEYGLLDTYFVRAGYRGNYDTDWLTTGFGVKWHDFVLDYAFAPFNVLGQTHRVSLSFFLPERAGRVVNFDGAARSSSSIKWYWGKSGKVDGYRIYGPEGLLVTLTAGDTRWVETGLSSGTIYTRTIKSFRGEEESKSPLSASARTYYGIGMRGVAVSTDSIAWYWNGVPEDNVYRIFSADPGQPRELKEKLYAGTTYWLETGLDAGGKYYRYVSALDNSGEEIAASHEAADTTYTIIEYFTKLLNEKAHNINFDTDKYDIREVDKPVLDAITELIISFKPPKIRIEGHTDNVGLEDHNQKLSQDRADSVMDYLVQHGVPLDTISAKGFGGTQPIASNDDENGRLTNRRVEFVIITTDGLEIRSREQK